MTEEFTQFRAATEISTGRSNVVKRKQGVTEEKEVTSAEMVSLRRSLGPFSCVGILIGTIVGSGIFITPQGVLIGSGSVGLALTIWIGCGIYSFLGGLAFAELGTLIPSSGGQYMYFLDCFASKRHRKKLFWGPLIAFLFSWYFNIFARPSAFAIQGLACSKYLIRLINIGCSYEDQKQVSELEIKLLAFCIMLVITVINCYSIKFSSRMVTFFTIIKLTGLLIIIGGGIYSLSQGQNRSLMTGFEGSNWSYGGISAAIYSGFWPYGGWNRLNMVTRELKNPKRDFLRSVTISLLVVVILYTLTNIAYFIVMSKEDFLKSEEVAIDFGVKLVGKFGVIVMAFIVECSIIGSTIGSTFLTVRMCYAAAREGHMPEALSFLSIKYMSPSVAVIFMFTIASLLMSQTDILNLIFVNGFISSIFMCVTMICLLIMRKTKADTERVITVSIFIPILILLVSLFLIVAPFLEKPRLGYIYGLIFLFVGTIVYSLFVYYKLRIPGTGIIKPLIQKVLLVAPPEDDEI